MTSRFSIVLAPALLLLLAACQDFETGVQTLCNAPRDCPECKDADPATRERAIAEHIGRSVRNDRARALFESLAGVDPQQRQTLLTEAAAKAGLSRCILAEFYADQAEPDTSPQ